jgi:1-acyl-sn-glycerol-3-phosphate acyltransferase
MSAMSDRAVIGDRRYLLWRGVGAVWRTAGALPFRVRATGLETLPQTGPYLLLPNHQGALDPPWVTQLIGRPAHYMASANLFRFPRMGPLITALGAFPKEKFVKDKDSMRRVAELYGSGLVVCIFPEGARTWDLRMNPVGEGLGRLIKRLDARVVYCRQHTSFHWQPRWAKVPRWVPIELEYDPPTTYAASATAAEITAHAVERMTVPLEHRFDGVPTFGLRMAEGLPDFLWACPSCHAPGALRPAGALRNDVLCGGCGARWRVTVEATLEPKSGGARHLTAAAAYDAILRHVGSPPVDDRATFDREGAALAVPGCAVGRVHRDRPEPELLAAGTLRVLRDGLEVGDGPGRWSVPFARIKAIPMEMHNTMQVRTDEETFAVDLGDTPTLRVVHFARSWHARRTGQEFQGG